MSIPRITEILEAMRGANITQLIQVEQHTISITIVNAAASQTDTITINGVACEFVSDATPTKKEVSDGLIAAIEASAQADNVLVTQGASPDYDVIINTANALDPTISVSVNLSDTPADGYAVICSVPCVMESLMLDPAMDGTGTAGTVTIADGATIRHVLPVGTVVPVLSYGAKFETSLRILLSEAADTGSVIWRTL